MFLASDIVGAPLCFLMFLASDILGAWFPTFTHIFKQKTFRAQESTAAFVFFVSGQHGPCLCWMDTPQVFV